MTSRNRAKTLKPLKNKAFRSVSIMYTFCIQTVYTDKIRIDKISIVYILFFVRSYKLLHSLSSKPEDKTETKIPLFVNLEQAYSE